ncbi:MAG: MATE family efflux transporter [Rhodobacteraceae bacterium]|jgi:MATE family multidrug resistance protein|uniref:Multidrug-efflux transporter n=1 Tax=Salipiger profundus TaxID=1229727 RepID=A0A1U7DAK5_9RHOB|nr:MULTISPECIES: MATE family efflux transporter [Salipiger]APX25142.1 multidrug resistance protein, MATE family [Salipiger profundus]MAB05482.1 MATE family efflux transporter [Paracoccaceae bacterium]GGA15605.1 MATE family efflux transporter [Salipiger profundus]SFD09767.1 multidrug resistance protein, MATE family [Salipiger profundus]
MTTRLPYRTHARGLLLLGLPLVGGHLAQMAIGLTDAAMIGRYGVAELAGLTLATTAFAVIFLFGSGFAWAVTPMIAQYDAEGNHTMIRRATRMSLWLSIGVFLLAMPLMWFSAPALEALGQAPQVARDAQTYLRVAGFGLLPALGVMVFKSYLGALEHTRMVFWITVLAALANALANYMLIFGNFGAPELGIRGAAVASLVSHGVSFAGCALYARVQLPQYPLWQRFWRPDVELLRDVFSLGLPIGLTTLAEVGLFGASAILIGLFGPVPLAAHGIGLQITAATFMIHLGLANAATIRAGQARGRRDAVFLRRDARTVFALSIAAVVVTVALFLLVPEALVGIFLSPDDPQREAILAIGVALLMVAAAFQLVDALQVVALGLLRGLQDTRGPMIIAAVSYWGLGLPAGWLLGLHGGFGTVGVWFGLTIGLGAAAVLLLLRFWRRALPALDAQQAARSLALGGIPA